MIGYLRTLLLFYRRNLRVQPLRELMAVAGVAAGVALLFTAQVAHRSITGSFEDIAQGVAGRATLELAARGPEGFHAHIGEEVERLPEVKAAASVFEQPIVVVGPKGRRALTLVGATDQISSLGGKLAIAFQHAGETGRMGLIVLTEATAHAIGTQAAQTIAVRAGERTERLAVAATVPRDQLGPAAESPIAASALSVVQALAGRMGHVTRVLVEPRPGRETALRRTLSDRFGSVLDVRGVDTEAKLLSNAADTEKQVTLLFSAISLVAGIILAYSDERRRFVVYLIETGAPDSMIVSSLAFDALILGLFGSLLGLLAGDGVSLFAYRKVPGYIAAAFPIGGQRVIDAQTIGLALAGGMIAALVATALPTLAILRRGAAAEPDAVGRTLFIARRLRCSDTIPFALGAAVVIASILLSATIPAVTVVALVALAAGLIVCVPLIARHLLELARRLSTYTNDPSARLAVAELRRSPTRTIALIATGTMAMFLTVTIGGSVADVQRAVKSGAADLLASADLWVKPGGPENVYTTQPFAYEQIAQRLARVDAVRSVLPWRDSFLDLPQRRVWVLGVPPQLRTQILPSQLVHGSLPVADRHLREGGWIAVSQPIALERHLRIGRPLTLPTPAGDHIFRLAATTANYGWLPGAIVMNADDHARLWQANTASQLAVVLKSGVSVTAGKRAVQAALPLGSGLVVKSTTERRQEVAAVLGSTLSRMNDTTIVVLVATVASMIALIVAAISKRRGRLDSLMSLGMSYSQLTRLVFYESGCALVVGCLIGTIAGLVGQDLIDGWLRHTTGAPVHFSAAWTLVGWRWGSSARIPVSGVVGGRPCARARGPAAF